jgi:hypothetical protein
MKSNKITITQDKLKDLFDYDNGKLIWKNPIKTLCHLTGTVAGTIHKSGYRQIRLDGVGYPAHRLIWIYHNGSINENLQIDHINGVKDNNTIENLRLVTAQQNCYNRSRLKSKGYTWNKNTNKWQASIFLNGKLKYLGSFINEQEARNIYLQACSQHHI